ncbi:hypothetical protein CXB51_036462 [Gossypium anomalum]|uniref:Uncharacterized protein n=1 Tax=Gossypium anomalum TaxID=47600 RepID=A0A8J5Y7R1_9ROSI|nr:hypothetical protein CXB51_036462 [Gossypium anomalum]
MINQDAIDLACEGERPRAQLALLNEETQIQGRTRECSLSLSVRPLQPIQMIPHPSTILPPYFGKLHYKEVRSTLFEDKPEGFAVLKPWNPRSNFDCYEASKDPKVATSGGDKAPRLGSAPG